MEAGAPGENPTQSTMQGPHRKAPPQPGLEPRFFLQFQAINRKNSLTLRQGTVKAKMLTVFWVLGLIYSTWLSLQLLISQEVVKRNGLSDLPAFIRLASCNTAVLHRDFHHECDVRGKWPLFEYGLCKQHS